MGNGIAHVAARAGYQVILSDIDPKALERALATISKNMDREAARGKFSAEANTEATARISTTVQLEKLSKADFIIEAVVENTDAKLKIFQTLDTVASPERFWHRIRLRSPSRRYRQQLDALEISSECIS